MRKYVSIGVENLNNSNKIWNLILLGSSIHTVKSEDVIRN